MNLIKLKPATKDYIWAGTKLKKYGKEAPYDNIAECWELSFHKDGPSIIDSGEDKGKLLKDVATKADLGEYAASFPFFPVLIKLIDSGDNLSVQVHPNDEYALKNENSFGKTEMWYVLEAEKGSGLYVGLKDNSSREEIEDALKNGTILSKLNFFPVKKGEVYFIQSGTIHAIGKGVTVIEIQQNSNLTYRLYDYNRLGKDGKPRELHIEKALQVTKRVPILRKKSFEPHIVDCDYFTVDKIVLDGQRMKKIFGEIDKTSFASLLVLDGTGKVQSGKECVEVQKGDSVFITANAGEYEMEGKFEALLTTV